MARQLDSARFGVQAEEMVSDVDNDEINELHTLDDE
jgi:hypothetical protein